MKNISTAFKFNPCDAELMTKIMAIDSEKQVEYFASVTDQLSDYGYWFLLSTLWVREATFAPISFWKELFSSKRPNRSISIMKPDELTLFKKLPNKLTVYRAHGDEADWISYTLNPVTAMEFSSRKKTDEIAEYKLKKHDCQALFLRRGEMEIICLNKELAKRIRTITVEKDK